MAITQNTYTGNGSTVLFSFTFPYLRTTDIKVSLDGSVTTAYTLANATTIQFNTAPDNGVTIRIYRETDDTDLDAEFFPGSAIRSQDLNDNFDKVLYIAQETKNITVQASTGNLPDGSITTNLIAAGAVSTSKIADGAVTDAKLSFTPLKTDVAQTFTAQQTFGELKETVYTLSGTAIDPANGSIQSKVLSGSVTFTDSLEAGQVVVLMLEGGDAHTVTWPTITWVTNAGNVAPTLTAKDTLVLWKVGTTLYGAYVGSYV